MQIRTVGHHQLTTLSQSLSSSTQPVFPLVLLLSMTSYGMEYPVGQLGSAVLAMPHLVGPCEKPKRPDFVSTAQQQLRHSCIINIVSITNPKYSPMLATKKLTLSHPNQITFY